VRGNAVTAFELVTADGELLRVDAANEPDLFWALRGGGGNYGLVTAVEFTVHPVDRVYAGALFCAIDKTADVLHTWHDELPSYPDELMTWAALMQFPPLPFVPGHLQGRGFAVVLGAFLGDEDEGRDLLGGIRRLEAEIDTFATLAPVGLAELAMDPPEPLPYRSAALSLRRCRSRRSTGRCTPPSFTPRTSSRSQPTPAGSSIRRRGPAYAGSSGATTPPTSSAATTKYRPPEPTNRSRATRQP
jgi:FAD/FMN-containing dehydrogenase